jgi:hypothetical protein
MSRNAFNQLDREYTEREDYLANRAEERKTVINACPFCGHFDIEVDEIEIGIIAICCPECLTIGPHQDGMQSVELAIEKWNRRK